MVASINTRVGEGRCRKAARRTARSCRTTVDARAATPVIHVNEKGTLILDNAEFTSQEQVAACIDGKVGVAKDNVSCRREAY